MRWLVLATLTLLALLASIAVARRSRPGGRAELALTTCIVWNALIGGPIYVLGLAKHLTSTSLGITTALLFTAVIVVAGWRSSFEEAARTLLADVVDLVTLPFAGIAIAKRARSVVVLALLLSAFLIAYTTVGSYFTPSWRQWDSLWYHEPIIGFTIQSHSIGPWDLPGDLQKSNGYPRFCEMVQLWFVIFTDRRLIEVTNSLIAPGIMYGTYVIARRYTRDVVSCMGWAAVVIIMPVASYLLQSTYIDVHVALFVLAGTHYATRPVFRVADAWLTALCVAMAVGGKYLALPPAGIITLIAIPRLFWQNGFTRRTFGAALGGFAIIGGMMWSIFWRNWIHFKNPLWPDFRYDDPARGISLPFESFGRAPNELDMTLHDVIESFLNVPYLLHMGRKNEVYDYGFAVTWIVFPLAAIAVLIVLFLAGRHLVARIGRVPVWRDPGAVNAFLILLPLTAQVATSPAIWCGRYHIANVAVLACLVAFWGGRKGWHNFGEGAAAAAAVASLIVFFWVQPRWMWFPSELVKLAAIPYPEREVTPAATISKTIWIASGSAITKEVGLEREKLKPGEIVAFGDNVQFPALLWNNDQSNKLVFVPGGAGYFDRVTALGARWVYCRNGDPECTRFGAAGSDWKDLGVYNVENWGHIYRRLSP